MTNIDNKEQVTPTTTERDAETSSVLTISLTRDEASKVVMCLRHCGDAHVIDDLPAIAEDYYKIADKLKAEYASLWTPKE